MNILELFAGSRSIGKVADELGYNTFSTDLYEFEGINKTCDILELDYKNIGFIPDIIWASPPCTSFSVASIGKHWNKDNTPKTEQAKLGILIVLKTLEIIEYYKNINPNLIWYIENPRGKLRKLDFMQNINGGVRNTLTYCQYGDNRMKPTDIWTNNIKWIPKKMCKNGDSCHISAPRGSQTGTQGLKGDYERSKIPYKLCKEILLNSI